MFPLTRVPFWNSGFLSHSQTVAFSSEGFSPLQQIVAGCTALLPPSRQPVEFAVQVNSRGQPQETGAVRWLSLWGRRFSSICARPMIATGCRGCLPKMPHGCSPRSRLRFRERSAAVCRVRDMGGAHEKRTKTRTRRSSGSKLF